MHLHVDTSSPVPPYEQIRVQIHTLVTNGSLEPGAKLPPIRQLARDLGLANNTVGRAYHELENIGCVESRGRHGTIVRGPGALSITKREVVLEQAALAFAQEAQRQGASLDGALTAVRDAFAHLHTVGASLDLDRRSRAGGAA